MNTKPPTPGDPVELVRQLDANAIRDRLDEIRHEQDALRVLLRAAQAAERRSGVRAGHD